MGAAFAPFTSTYMTNIYASTLEKLDKYELLNFRFKIPLDTRTTTATRLAQSLSTYE